MPPVTLSQPQFQKLRPNGNYQSYLQFVANRRGVPASSLAQGAGAGAGAGAGGSSLAKAATADPANALAGLLGYTPLTSAQIEKKAQSEISPIIAAATNQANQQAATQAQQITGLTQDYANELGQINFASPYQSAEGQQAAVDAALQQSLTGQGANLAGGLADRLKALQGTSGGAAVQQAANALSSQGQSSGNTALANGSANLSDLIANQAAESDFGQKLPAIAKLSGLQALGQSAATQQKAIADATLQAESQIPNIVQDLTANQQRALANAVAAEQKQQSLEDANHWKGVAAQQAEERVGISAANSQTSQGRLTLDSRKFAQTTLQQNRSYQLALARVGIQKQSMQLRAATLDYKMANGGFTPTQVSKFRGQLQQGLETMPAGASYSDFVKQAVSKGIPLTLAIQAGNQHWPATQRPAPGDIASIVGATQADVNATGWQQSLKNYDQAVGMPNAKGQVELATGPQGQKVMLQMPKTVTPAIRTIVNDAVDYLGTPYAWGGESSKGFDCSGLAQYVYGKAGVQIPRTTYDQFQTGKPIAKSQLQAGDLVFFKGSDSKNGLPGHVGIYIGGGQLIEAPHTGSVVQVSKLAGHADYMGARRYGASG